MTQPLPLREQMRALEQTQELDLKIDALKKRKAALPAAIKALEDAFNRVQTTIDQKKNAITEIEKLQRQTQAAMDLNRDRLTRANSKLEAVHNGQEFQAANKEIDQLKKLNGSLEEQNKKSETDKENIQKEIDALAGQYEKVKGDRDAQLAVVNEQSGSLDKEIESLMAERRKHSSLVEPRTLSNYERVRGARGGIGFVPAVGGRCSGCNMMVPPQLYNEVQRGQNLQSCPSCHRILFVPAPSPSAEASAN